MGIERVMHNMIHMRFAVFLITYVSTPSEQSRFPCFDRFNNGKLRALFN